MPPIRSIAALIRWLPSRIQDNVRFPHPRRAGVSEQHEVEQRIDALAPPLLQEPQKEDAQAGDPVHNVAKFKPTLVLDEDDADRLVSNLDQVLGEDALRLTRK